MNLPRFGVNRPVLTSMLTLILVVLGIASMARLQVDLFPAIERPTASVRTNYVGASPEVVERQVTQIVEEIVSTVPGVVEITSTSQQGESNVSVRFDWGSSIDIAVQDLRARMEDELNELPDDVERPTLRKFDINSFPVVLLGVSSPLDPIELNDLVENELRDRLARVPGVAQVDPWGGYAREIRVAVHRERLAAANIDLQEVVTALRNANLDLPAGRIEQGQLEIALRAPSELPDLDTLRATAVATRGGSVVTIGQVATVLDTYQELDRIVRVGEQLGIRLAIRKQASANTVEVAAAVLAEVARVNRDMPQLTVVPVINQGNFIEQSIHNVGRAVLYGAGFAVLVLLFFLRNLRSTAVVAAAIPISVVGTFAPLYAGGFTLNLMTLGGLALGVGMMVDSAIVVLENIFRWRERGLSASEAAIGGASEVAPAIVASTITTLVIFLPVVYLQGIAGLLFAELAYVIVFALVVSLVVSLTVVPMLASSWLTAQGSETSQKDRQPAPSWTDPLVRASERALSELDAAYTSLLEMALSQRALTLVAAGVLLLCSLFATPWISTGFLPPTDEGEVRVTGEMALGTRIGVVDQQTQLIEAVTRQAVPEAIASVTSIRGGATGDAEGEVRLALGPAGERSRSNTEVAADLRKRLDGQIPGMTIRTRAPQGSFALNRLLGNSEEGVTVEVRGDDLEQLDAIAAQVMTAIADVPGVTDITDSRPEERPEAMLHIDRGRVAQVGLTVRAVAELLETALAGRAAGNYRDGDDAVRIFVQLSEVRSTSLDDILDLTLRTPSGSQVSLRSLVTIAPGTGPVEIARKDKRRLLTVTANIAGRALGSAASDIQARLDDVPRPAGVSLVVTGAWEAQQEAFGELRLSLLLALALVYMVLAGQYESLRDPLVVMVSVPFAAIGVVAVLAGTSTALDLQSGIGCVMLGGIVVNNAILLVDHASRERRENGCSAREAALLAGRRRLRPILMTTLTTLLGLVPLALGLGEGADAQAPLARVVVGGLTASTALSVFLIPVVYTVAYARPASSEPG